MSNSIKKMPGAEGDRLAGYEKEVSHNLPQSAQNVKGAIENTSDKIGRIFDYILKETKPIYDENPVANFQPNDTEQCAAFCAYFKGLVIHNDAHGFRVFDPDTGKWEDGEIAKAVVVRLIQWVAKQRFDLRESADDADAKRYAKEAQGGRAIMRIFEMLKCAGELKKLPHELNPHKHIKNFNGIAVNLKTGEQRPAMPGDFFTKSTNYRPMESYEIAVNSCPHFMAFTVSVLSGRKDLCEYLMTFLGYCLTGEMTEQKALFILGLTGCNGKSTFINLLKLLLGDYIVELPDSVIFKTNDDGKFAFAELEGAILATKADIPAGVAINTGNFKNITGGDCKLRAEKKFHDAYYFTPQCKIILACNNRPRLPETGGAMERRIALMPFEANFREKQDKHLLEKLLDEAPAIMAILIEYSRRWYKKGLPKSETIEANSRAYMLDEDIIMQFISEKCAIEDGAFTPRGEMEAAINNFVGKTLSKKTIKERLEAKGFKITQSGKGEFTGKRGYLGIQILVS